MNYLHRRETQTEGSIPCFNVQCGIFANIFRVSLSVRYEDLFSMSIIVLRCSAVTTGVKNWGYLLGWYERGSWEEVIVMIMSFFDI